MSKVLVVAAIVAIAGFLCMPAFAGTLYQNEGTGADLVPTVTGHAPAGNLTPNKTNWVSQSGAGSWEAVDNGTLTWRVEGTNIDTPLMVEADVENYGYQWWENQDVYFHVGNIFGDLSSLVALVNGGVKSNYQGGLAVGLMFPTSLQQSQVNFTTGTITDVMAQVNGNSKFDAQFTMTSNGGVSYLPPNGYYVGSNNYPALWWNLPGSPSGIWNVQWKIQALPHTNPVQAPGDYVLDPCIILLPAM